jgi:hypothetical protein
MRGWVGRATSAVLGLLKAPGEGSGLRNGFARARRIRSRESLRLISRRSERPPSRSCPGCFRAAPKCLRTEPEGDGDRRVRARPVDARYRVAVREGRARQSLEGDRVGICQELREPIEHFKRRDLYDIGSWRCSLSRSFCRSALTGPRRGFWSPGGSPRTARGGGARRSGSRLASELRTWRPRGRRGRHQRFDPCPWCRPAPQPSQLICAPKVAE